MFNTLCSLQAGKIKIGAFLECYTELVNVPGFVIAAKDSKPL